MRSIVGAAAASAVLAIIAAAGAQEGVKDANGDVDVSTSPSAGAQTCLTLSRINDFDGLSERHVYVANGRDHYLLTMDHQCHGLADAENISIANPSNRICSNSLAELRYRGVSGRLETCLITSVESVEDKAAARRIVEERTATEKNLP